MSCAAVIYDMDGLMIDSEPLWHVAEKQAFGAIGVELDESDCAATLGLRIDEAVQHHYAHHRQGGWDESPAKDGTLRTQAAVAANVVDIMERLLRERGGEIAKPGLEQSIAFFAAKRLPLGLASSSPKRLIDAGLAGLGLDQGQFKVVVSAENEEHGKPHPGVYISAAKALGVEPMRCLALEDSLNGTLAAKAARMRCISVPEVFEVCSRGFGIADVLLPSLEKIDGAVFDQIWAA
jgi:sugar-phosphatase